MKISKSNFIVISVTMITVLFLFQFSNISALYTSRATVNSHANTTTTITASQTIQKNDLYSDMSYTVAIVDKNESVSNTICSEWCVYNKKTFYSYNSLKNLYHNLSSHCQWLFLSGKTIEDSQDISILKKLTETGIHIIFTSLPSVEQIEQTPELSAMLGIQDVIQKEYHTSGITLYEGFLLGGRINYKKIRPTLPYYRLGSGVKTYMTGSVRNQSKQKIKNEELPPIIWRHHYENSFVFAVNGEFFKDHTGLGFLSAMVSDTESYAIYPVINAQCTVCENFPYLANENSAQIAKQYYYSTKALFENVIWPDMVSILNATNEAFTGMIAPKLEYAPSSEPARKDSLEFYFKQTEKISGELGISGDIISNSTDYHKKIKEDSAFLQENVPNYAFTVFSPGNMPEEIYRQYLKTPVKESAFSNVRTILNEKEEKNTPLLSFYSDTILTLAKTSNGFSHTNREDLYLKSIETALGFNVTAMDLKKVLYSSDQKNDWTQLSKKASSYLDTYYKVFRDNFEQVTVSKADEKTRQFLALNYISHRQSDTINLSLTDYNGYASFLLTLTNEKIISISGATYKQIEKDKYVINAQKADITIQVASDLN